MELTKDIIERIYSVIESSRKDGRIRKGVNEVTKSLERGEAKLSVVATDVSPSEIIQHLALLAKDKEIIHVEVPSKAELGAAAGLPVATAAVAIANPGEAQKKLKNLIEDIQTLMKAEAEPKKAEKPSEAEAKEETVDKSAEPVEEKPAEKEAPKEKVPAEEKKEEVVEEKVEEAPAESEEKTEEVVEEPAEPEAETSAEEEKPKKEEAEKKTE